MKSATFARIAMILFAFSMMFCLGGAHAGAPLAKSVTAHAKTGTEAEAKQHIKGEELKNSTGKTFAAPRNKGGKNAAPIWTLHVDNHTDWYTHIFIDGIDQGRVGPWGDLYIEGIDSGDHEIYGAAYFDDGSTKTFGSITRHFPPSLTWSLYP